MFIYNFHVSYTYKKRLRLFPIFLTFIAVTYRYYGAFFFSSLFLQVAFMYRNVECNVFFIVIAIIIIILIVFMVCYDIITKVISLRENTQTEEMWKLKKCEQPKTFWL